MKRQLLYTIVNYVTSSVSQKLTNAISTMLDKHQKCRARLATFESD